MKKYLPTATAVLLLTGAILLSCDPDVDIPGEEKKDQYTMLYMPQAEGGPRTYTLDIKDVPDEFTLGVAYGGIGSVNEDINASIVIDPARVDEYNTQKGTAYTPLPEEAYTLSGNSVTIPHGSFTSTPMTAFVQTEALTPFREYMLVAKIGTTDAGIPINEKLKEAVIILKTSPDADNYPVFDRTNWLVESFSTEEPKEATWGNGGQVIHTLDGNNNTFWHSKWDGGEAPPPHWFVIDMGEMKAMHGLSFLARQSDNDGKPNEVTVELSTDGISWSPGGSFNLENTRNLQRRFLIDGFNSEARYFKVTVRSSYNAVYTHLAEIHAF